MQYTYQNNSSLHADKNIIPKQDEHVRDLRNTLSVRNRIIPSRIDFFC